MKIIKAIAVCLSASAVFLLFSCTGGEDGRSSESASVTVQTADEVTIPAADAETIQGGNNYSEEEFHPGDARDFDEIPHIDFERTWATLNVMGWDYADIPVINDSSKDITTRAAATDSGSCFCGEGGKIILFADEETLFYEIEDSKIGDIVTMDTIYGSYRYEVKDIVIFVGGNGAKILSEPAETETLVLYTMYPRDSTEFRQKERIALICEKTYGKDFEN